MRKTRAKATETPVTTPDAEITLDRVISSGLLLTGTNPVLRLGVARDGGTWFKDTLTGRCYRVINSADGGLIVAQVHESKKATKTAKPSRITIKCVECGAEREIASQDVFQVKRCAVCQKRYVNRRRAERAKSKRAENRRTKELSALNSIPKAE